MFALNSPYHRFLHFSILFAVVPWLYSYFNEQRRMQSYSVEQILMIAWEKVISHPSIPFRRTVIGFNCNVDLIVSGIGLLERSNVSTIARNDHEILNGLNDLYEAFAHFFSRGAAAERTYLLNERSVKVIYFRHTANEEMFQALVHTSGSVGLHPQYFIGGNAALMAEKIASSFPRTTVTLVGPIGPRSEALLHPSIVRSNSTRIVKDEIHIIMEYRQGEILGEYVAPASSRFITSHDQYSGSSVVIEMFFKAIAQFQPDLIILTGIHLIQNQHEEMRLEKLRLIERNLLQLDSSVPIHLQFGSIGNSAFVSGILEKIIPNVDSLSINEQELALLSHVANGPYIDLYPISPGAVHVHKVVEMLYWLITSYGHRDPSSSREFKHRLSRIHFHSLTFHLMVYRGTDWSNLAAALAAGARTAAQQSCNAVSGANTENLDLRASISHILDKKMEKTYHFEAQKPLASWMRNDIVFIYTPVLVCKFPTKTVGIDDAIAATGLLYSQFHRFSAL